MSFPCLFPGFVTLKYSATEGRLGGGVKGDRGEDLKWHFSNAGLLGAPRAWGLELGNTGESDTAGECQPLHSLGLSRAHCVW